MRGEAGGARGKAGARTSGTNYPPISAAYWLPPSNPTPYHVPVLRMRGEAGGARGKAGARTSGTNYPPISAAYWLPPSNPTPYHVPGSVLTPHSLRTRAL
uniref:Uncharacterized protein n=1 Tax=Heliothis virescens TaxID=7102 RepID=A0A2A4JPV7_HELVI